jgi:hypothetical protein
MPVRARWSKVYSTFQTRGSVQFLDPIRYNAALNLYYAEKKADRKIVYSR